MDSGVKDETTSCFYHGAGVMLFAGRDFMNGLTNSDEYLVGIPTAAIGIRIQPEKGGLFRLNFTPMILPNNGGLIIPYAGVSFGFTFLKDKHERK